MATRVAAAGGGAFTSGATWVGGSAPGAGDDAQLTNTSGNVTIDTGAVCRSLDCVAGGSYTGTLTHTAGVTIAIGDGTAGTGNVALKFSPGMTYTRGSTTTSVIQLNSTSATQQTITTATKLMAAFTINAPGGSYIHSDAFSTGAASGSYTLSAGSVNTGNFNITAGSVVLDNGATQSFTGGTSIITCIGQRWAVLGTGINEGANVTVSLASATITVSASSSTFTGGAKTYGTVNLTGSSTCAVGGANTFATLTRTGTAAKADSVSFSANQVITGALTLNSNSSVNRLQVFSTVIGTPRTLTAGSLVATNVIDFQDITNPGTAWTTAGSGATSFGDCGGNTGITPTPAATQTRSGAGGNWSTAGNWTSRVPLPQDNVIIPVGATSTITGDMPRLGADQTYTGFTGTLNITATPTIYGSVTLGSGMTFTASNAFTLAGRGTHLFTSNTIVFPRSITMAAFGGSYTLQDALTISVAGNLLTVNNGSFDGNGKNVSIGGLSSNVSTTRSITGGTASTWTLSGQGTIWNTSTTGGLTFSGANINILITDTTSNQKTWAASPTAGQHTVNSITISAGASNDVRFNGVTATTFTINAPNNVSFNPNQGAVKTIGNFVSNGAPAQPINISANPSTSAPTINITTSQSVSYTSFINITVTGLTIIDRAGKNNGGNTNIVFDRLLAGARSATSGRSVATGRSVASSRSVVGS